MNNIFGMKTKIEEEFLVGVDMGSNAILKWVFAFRLAWSKVPTMLCVRQQNIICFIIDPASISLQTTKQNQSYYKKRKENSSGDVQAFVLLKV